MKAFPMNLALAGMALVPLLGLPAVLAADSNDSKPESKAITQSEPSSADLKTSKDRGLIFSTVNVGVGAGASLPAPVLPVNKGQSIHQPAVKHVGNLTNKKRTGQLKKAIPVTGSASHNQLKAQSSASKTNSVKKATAVTSATSSSPVVNHEQAAATEGAVIKAWLDKSGANPAYKVGEKMTINVSASSDVNVVVFDFDGKNSLKQIFPNEYQQNGLIKSGNTVSIGGQESPFDYQVAGAGGKEKIFVYAYPVSASSPLTVAMISTPNSPFRSAEMSLEKYRDLVNKSKVFFSREVKVIPKQGFKPVSDSSSNAPNKIELTFDVQP